MGYNSGVSSWPSLLSCLTLDNHLSATLGMPLFLSLKLVVCVCVGRVLGIFQRALVEPKRRKASLFCFPGIAEAADNRH